MCDDHIRYNHNERMKTKKCKNEDREMEKMETKKRQNLEFQTKHEVCRLRKRAEFPQEGWGMI